MSERGTDRTARQRERKKGDRRRKDTERGKQGDQRQKRERKRIVTSVYKSFITLPLP